MSVMSQATSQVDANESSKRNEAVVRALWEALSARDWPRLVTWLTDDAFYEDVPTPDPGAHGAENVVIRLRTALDHIERHEHEIHRLLVDGDQAILEHTEWWHFPTDDPPMKLDFVTVHELRDGKVALWRDYWDIATMMGQLPQWFLDEIAKHSQEEFGG